jgi:hypothetical protein
MVNRAQFTKNAPVHGGTDAIILRISHLVPEILCGDVNRGESARTSYRCAHILSRPDRLQFKRSLTQIPAYDRSGGSQQSSQTRCRPGTGRQEKTLRGANLFIH